MLSTVVALGNSGINWKPRGLTIGVNEYLMWGRQAEVMVLVNAPHKFSLDEMNLIKQHKGKVMTNSPGQWSKYFPHAELLKHMGQFNLRVQKGRIYSSATSPMIAISYAMTQGATEIILYGVDFKNHSKYKEGSKHGDHEVAIYKRFFASCDKIGVKIRLGAYGSAFDEYLPHWEHLQ